MRKRAAVKRIVRKFHKRLEEVLGTKVQVILYGSHARGDAEKGFGY